MWPFTRKKAVPDHDQQDLALYTEFLVQYLPGDDPWGAERFYLRYQKSISRVVKRLLTEVAAPDYGTPVYRSGALPYRKSGFYSEVTTKDDSVAELFTERREVAERVKVKKGWQQYLFGLEPELDEVLFYWKWVGTLRDLPLKLARTAEKNAYVVIKSVPGRVYPLSPIIDGRAVAQELEGAAEGGDEVEEGWVRVARVIWGTNENPDDDEPAEDSLGDFPTFGQEALERGADHEMEHVKDIKPPKLARALAEKVAADHLAERGDYYEVLDRCMGETPNPKLGALCAALEGLREEMATAAQGVLDEWQPDEEGLDDELGGGGACDRVADALADVISSHLGDWVSIQDGGQDGDDHAFLVAVSDDEACGVDIAPSHYESGGGFSWTKLPDVHLGPAAVDVWPMNRDDVVDEDDDDRNENPGIELQWSRYRAPTGKLGKRGLTGKREVMAEQADYLYRVLPSDETEFTGYRVKAIGNGHQFLLQAEVGETNKFRTIGSAPLERHAMAEAERLAREALARGEETPHV
jgi:hypothetical protein